MKKLRAELEKLADEKYRNFSAKLLPKTEKLIGVRIPELRKLAKRATAENWELSSDDTFEETMVAALALAYEKLPPDEKSARMEAFLPRIKNWSVCDSFCETLKIDESEKAQYFALVQKYIDSKDEFSCRVAYVMLLAHFAERGYLDFALSHFEKFDNPHYYAQMACAWCAATFLAKFPAELADFLLSDRMRDKKALQMARQKVRDSFRTPPEIKAQFAETRGARRQSSRGRG